MKKLTAPLTIASLGALVLLYTSCNETEAQAEEHDKEATPAVPALPMSPVASPAGAKVYIISPKDGAKVGQKVTVRFGLKGMGVAPAGIYVEGKSTGHHHLIVDADMPDLKLPFPMDEKHYFHFGGGQTETEIELEPGEHTLQLVLGDHAHVPHNPPVVSDKITITVK